MNDEINGGRDVAKLSSSDQRRSKPVGRWAWSWKANYWFRAPGEAPHHAVEFNIDDFDTLALPTLLRLWQPARHRH
jgi:hypothetical protein